jgi:hypothetical protein
LEFFFYNRRIIQFSAAMYVNGIDPLQGPDRSITAVSTTTMIVFKRYDGNVLTTVPCDKGDDFLHEFRAFCGEGTTTLNRL